MSVRAEYVSARSPVEYTDERNLSFAESPEAQDVIAISYDEVIVLTGTPEELTAFAKRIIRAILAGATPYEEPRICKGCDDEVQYLSTDNLCDGCVAEADSGG